MANEYTSNATTETQQRLAQGRDQLAAFLQAADKRNADAQTLQVHGQQAKDQLLYKDQLGQAGQARNISNLKDLLGSGDLPDGSGASLGENGNVSVTKGMNPMMGQAQQDRRDKQRDNKVEALSKRTEKDAPLSSAVNTIESLTNKDGQGGVVSNPNAQEPGSGSIASRVQSPWLVSAAETLGLMAPGTGQYRAAKQAIVNDYAHKMYGARVTPEQMQREYVAHGIVPGADPALAAKAMRQRVSDIQSSHQARDAGYNPDVRDQFQQGGYTDPLQGLKVYKDSLPGQAPQQQAAPQTPSPAPKPGLSSLGIGPQSGPHGPSVTQDGHTYNWNPQTKNYE